jgi:hypothetical protein
MPIIQGSTDALRSSVLTTLASHTLKIALYTSSATLNNTTATYTTTNEVVASGTRRR